MSDSNCLSKSLKLSKVVLGKSIIILSLSIFTISVVLFGISINARVIFASSLIRYSILLLSDSKSDLVTVTALSEINSTMLNLTVHYI